MSIDQEKLNQFMQKAVGDLGAIFHAALVVIGDKLGLYRAMAEAGPATSSELAKRGGAAERYVREWLAANAASGYVKLVSKIKPVFRANSSEDLIERLR